MQPIYTAGGWRHLYDIRSETKQYDKWKQELNDFIYEKKEDRRRMYNTNEQGGSWNKESATKIK